jgi:uncharacterized tellurite resistance protein B-like protein
MGRISQATTVDAMFERFRHSHQALHGVEASDDEHLAALELMLLVAVADRTVSITELEQVEHEVESGGWETATINYEGMFGSAMARVPSVPEGGVAAFVEDCARRISAPDLRRAVRGACKDVAKADGVEDPTEHEVLREIDRRFTNG